MNAEELQRLLDHPDPDGVVTIPAGVYRFDTPLQIRNATRIIAGAAS